MLSYNKILAPVDFADVSYNVLEKAARHSEDSQSEFIVTHIVDSEHSFYQGLDIISDTSAQATLIRNAEHRLDDLLEKLEIGYCETLIRAGRTVPTLIEVIDELRVDLVVMGTHRQHPDSALYKSATHKIIERVECDVLVLHAQHD